VDSSNNSTDLLSHPTAEQVRDALRRVLANATFQNSERLSRFLRFVVEETLAGQADQLKEYRIGVEVFGRPDSYDPRLDPVVRLEARRLRARLQAYYEADGRSDVVQIQVPKGGYAAHFALIPAREPASKPVGHIGSSGQPGSARADLYEPSWGSGFVKVPQGRRRRRLFIITVTVLVFMVTAAAIIYVRSRFTVSQQPTSLAVLPFVNLTGHPDDEYLSDGVTDELTSSIANTPGLRVVARTSAFKFKGKGEDVREIGRQLNVASVLEGSIQTQGDRLRITAQLIRTSDGSHLWSQVYERPFKDSFALEDEISRALSAALSAKLSAHAESSAQSHDVDAVSHELVLRAYYLLRRTMEADVRQAIPCFNQALDRDPLYAQAYAGLAATYGKLGANAWAPADEVYPKGLAAAKRAVELDDTLSDAHESLAFITFMYEWRAQDAEPEYRRAIELNPNNAVALQHYGIMLHYCGRFDEALQRFKLAKAVDPIDWPIDVTTLMVYESQGNYEAAIALDRKVLSENSNVALLPAFLGALYADEKRYPEAIAEAQKAIVLAGDNADIDLNLAQIYAESGDREQAIRILRKVLARKTEYIPPFTVAGTYAALGDKDRMYEWLDKAIEQHQTACLKLQVVPIFRPYLAEPRFQSIVSKTHQLPVK